MFTKMLKKQSSFWKGVCLLMTKRERLQMRKQCIKTEKDSTKRIVKEEDLILIQGKVETKRENIEKTRTDDMEVEVVDEVVVLGEVEATTEMTTEEGTAGVEAEEEVLEAKVAEENTSAVNNPVTRIKIINTIKTKTPGMST